MNCLSISKQISDFLLCGCPNKLILLIIFEVVKLPIIFYSITLCDAIVLLPALLSPFKKIAAEFIDATIFTIQVYLTAKVLLLYQNL